MEVKQSTVTPYPADTTRWAYSRTEALNKEILALRGRPEVLVKKLTDYLFDHHPMVPDHSPIITHRFQEVKRVTETLPRGKELLTKSVSLHLKAANKLLQEEKSVYAITFTLLPALEFWNGSPARKIKLPEAIRNRTLACNQYVLNKIDQGELYKLFDESTNTALLRIAEGALLPVGNLLIEVTQGVARIRTKFHDKHKLVERWNFTFKPWPDMPEYANLDEWVVMTHVTDKGLLKKLEEIGDEIKLASPMIESLKLNRAIYVRSYPEIISLIKENPDLKIRGVLSDESWIYNPKLEELFPQQEVGKLHQVAGDVVVIGNAEEMNLSTQVKLATYDAKRSKAHEEGKFEVGITARFIDVKGMIEATKIFGDKVALEKLNNIAI